MEGQSKQYYKETIRSRIWDNYKTTGLISNKSQSHLHDRGEMVLN